MWVSARFRLKMDLIAMWECLRIVVSMMKMVWLWLMVGRGPLGFEARPPSRLSVIRNPITINNAPRNPFW
ncbi:MAG: hypothetical protein DRN54_03555 [Thaumarchaeota archaeon]|nr:MAG: hypothetical protein DRN54_03555 [Nitrososphaerota archaeon]